MEKNFNKNRLKKVLRNMGSVDPIDYVLSAIEKMILGFNVIEVQQQSLPCIVKSKPKLYSLDAEWIITTKGKEVSKISVVDEEENIVFDKLIKVEGGVMDCITHITGLTEEILMTANVTLKEAQEFLSKLFVNNIIIGHDLSNDLNKLAIGDYMVIDTVVLYPHQDGLPAKRSLKEITLQYLHYDIQINCHASVEDALAALRLTKVHIKDGNGKVVVEEIPSDVDCIFTEVTPDMISKLLELDEQRIYNINLRGSRCVGTNGVRFDGNMSDWDFVVVMDLEKNFEDQHLVYGNIDVALYDVKTFQSLVVNNVIWALECIFAPKHCILKEKIDFRKSFIVDLAKLRNSVSYESERLLGKGKRRNDPYVAFKCIFIALRFYEYAIQLCQYGFIKDLSTKNSVWEKMKSQKDIFMTWDEIYSYYKPILKETKHEFTQMCPYQNQYHPQSNIKQKNKMKNLFFANEEFKQNIPNKNENNLNYVLKVQQYLLNNSPETLAKEFKIDIRRHSNYPNLIQLHYTIFSDFDQIIPCECRGLILDQNDNWKIISFPYAKFFDYADKHCNFKIDWESAIITEKIDGSIATLYFYDNKWNVSSSSIPDGKAPMCFKNESQKTTMENLFWSIFQEKKYKLPSNNKMCYMFEVIAVNHIIVVDYKENNLILHGIRNLEDLKECEIATIAEEYGWNYVKKVKIVKSLEEVVNDVIKMDGSKHEGFVIRDKFFNRIKVKNPEYLRRSWMFPICPTRSNMNDRHILHIIRENEEENFVKYCPEWKTKLFYVKEKYERLREEIDIQFKNFEKIKDAKAFALAISSNIDKNAFFSMKKGGISSKEYLSVVRINYLEERLGLSSSIYSYKKE